MINNSINTKNENNDKFPTKHKQETASREYVTECYSIDGSVVVTGNGKRPPQSESGSDVWNDVTFTYPEPASTGRNLVARQDLVWQVPDARPTAVLEYIWSIWLSITLCIIGSHKVTSTISILATM